MAEKRATILVVEDDPDLSRAMQLLLEAEGYCVACAEDGDQALQALQNDMPDLVLLDVMLTHVLEGIALAREMVARPEWASIPVIIVSSIKQSEYAEYVPDTGPLENIIAFLPKPVDPQTLLQLIREELGSKG
ncbi:MAG: response regulator [Armatimonadetes bacterium]|nr:response regulator [Armatimonadota bacterium]